MTKAELFEKLSNLEMGFNDLLLGLEADCDLTDSFSGKFGLLYAVRKLRKNRAFIRELRHELDLLAGEKS